MKKLPILSLPIYKLKLKVVQQKTHIFDVVRKKYLLLTPEEWVRQNFIHYLNKEKKYPLGLMGIEKMVKYNSLKSRADIVLYNTDGNPNIIIECKAPEVKITQDTFYQIAKYNSKLKVQYLIVTNGMKHYCCSMDYDTNAVTFLEEIPVY
ncbi:MAG: restriction endonuclease subunit R [Flavobacteriales bacterium]|nr:restriction endonuclease subunit R [Flavobacteriales bacterium]